jgi:uncharacterized protein YbaA (DUF1428 family)
MAIPESQLETWSGLGAVTQSKNTYASIRGTLLDADAAYAAKSFEVFLQGSYGNDTNIYAESDVDVVIRLDSIMRSDLSALPAEQQQAYHSAYGKAAYTFAEFKGAVTDHLVGAYGADVDPGNKAVKIKANGTRRNADVVICFQYRRYLRFVSEDDQEYIPGIIFPSQSSGEIINYPKRHSENCTTKHRGTHSYFKPTARILKNMRSRLVADGKIPAGTAPSYYLEGLLYNVPNEKFGTSYGDTLVNSINWLLKTDRTQLVCANEQYYLLGDGNVQWPTANCDQFLSAVVEMWKNW